MSISTGLIALYRFDGNSNATPGTNNGVDTAITYGTGIINQAAITNGTTSRIDIATSSDLILGSANFTFSIWVKKLRINTEEYIFLHGDGLTAVNSQINVRIGVNNFVRTIVCHGGTITDLTSTAGVADANWHLITIVRDGTTLRVYIDGVARGTTAIGTNIVNNSAYTMVLGSGQLNDFKFQGSMDEFRIYHRALSATEVLELYKYRGQNGWFNFF